jgi:hypothetical protein
LDSTSFFSAAGLPAKKFVGAIASSNSDTTKRARSVVVGSIFRFVDAPVERRADRDIRLQHAPKHRIVGECGIGEAAVAGARQSASNAEWRYENLRPSNVRNVPR